MSNVLETHEMAALLKLVEEAARSTEAGVKHFVEPAPGTLQRTINKRHHIVFGRRGSGKSSLLRKAAAVADRCRRRSLILVVQKKFKDNSMKKIQIFLLLSSCLAARAGVSLGTGDTFVCTFESLSFTQFASGNLDPRTGVGIKFVADNMLMGEQLKVEVFEDSIADTPFGSTTFMGVGAPPYGLAGASYTLFDTTPHWQDLQGTVRLTMLNGSVTFNVLDFTAQIGINLYSGTYLVPEPTAAALLTLGCVILYWRPLWRK